MAVLFVRKHTASPWEQFSMQLEQFWVNEQMLQNATQLTSNWISATFYLNYIIKWRSLHKKTAASLFKFSTATNNRLLNH